MSCQPAHYGEMRVLVAEDHATLAGRLARGLSQAGMAVDLTVGRARHGARRGCRRLSLTRKRFGTLETLLAADGAVDSRGDRM